MCVFPGPLHLSLMNMSPETLNVGDTVSVHLKLQKLKPSLAATQSLLLVLHALLE